MEANKDQSLARRVQRLQRFLMDKLHREALERETADLSEDESEGNKTEKEDSTIPEAKATAEAKDQPMGRVLSSSHSNMGQSLSPE